MFQYAAARSRSLELGTDLLLDTSWFKGQRLRSFELSPLILPEPLLFASTSIFGRCAIVNHPEGRRHIKVRREKGFHAQFALTRTPGDCLLLGYFQSPSYFSHGRELVCSELTSLRQPSTWFSDARARIEAGVHVGVHVRRGDYVNDHSAASVHGPLDGQYYREALQIMSRLAPDAAPILFTDDLAGAATAIPELVGMSVLTPPVGTAPIESLLLFAACHHAIIANSSFSWWGAFLGQNTNRHIIAPRPWFLDRSKDPTDLLPGNWLTLGR